MKTETLIRKARELLKPYLTQFGLPRWAKKILGDPGIHRPWMDHMGTGTSQYADLPDDCWISEPYDFGIDEAEDLNAFCLEHGLEYHIESNSWHFPGRTVRIVIYPKVDG